MESDLRSPSGASSLVFLYAGLYLANNIFFMTMAVIISIYGLSSGTIQSLGDFLTKNLNQTCIEVVRSWGKTLTWSFALLIPGFIKYLQFLFVPFVVTLLPAYEKGEVDALRASAVFFKKHWGQVLVAIVGFQGIWSYMSLSLFDSYRLILQTPLSAVMISLLESGVFLLYILVLFNIYSKSAKEVKHESLV